MGWGVSYKYNGYLSRMVVDSLESELKDYRKLVDQIYKELLAYMVATPQNEKDSEGNELPYPEALAVRIGQYREQLDDYYWWIHHIEDCLEAFRENKDNVTGDCE